MTTLEKELKEKINVIIDTLPKEEILKAFRMYRHGELLVRIVNGKILVRRSSVSEEEAKKEMNLWSHYEKQAKLVQGRLRAFGIHPTVEDVQVILFVVESAFKVNVRK